MPITNLEEFRDRWRSVITPESVIEKCPNIGEHECVSCHSKHRNWKLFLFVKMLDTYCSILRMGVRCEKCNFIMEYYYE
jgi:hypothetical protein